MIPDLGIANQQDAVIGRISRLVSKIFPNSHCSADNIYRLLIDELHRKGTVTYDYNEWDNLLKNKALTSSGVAEAIKTHIKVHDMQDILSEAGHASSELGYTFMQKKEFKQSIRRIHLKTIGFPSALTLKIRDSIKTTLSSAFSQNRDDLKTIVTYVSNNLPSKIKDNLGTEENIISHVLYEIIVSD